MTASPVRVTVQWIVPYGQTRAITTALNELMIATRNERGCVECSLATEVEKSVRLCYQETWETEEDLRRHVRSDRFSMLAGLVEQATEVPLIDFALPGGHRGIDYAKEARQGSAPNDPSHANTAGAHTSRGGHRPRVWRLQGHPR